MRKRISCKIIKSVPLDAGGTRSAYSVPSAACFAKRRTMNGKRRIGTSTYTPRMVVIKTCIDEKPTAQFLDCRA